MSLSETISKISTGVFHIVFLNSRNERLGSGSGFISCAYLITNCHNIEIPASVAKVWIRQEGEADVNQGLILTPDEVKKRILSASDKNNYDYAILEMPELLIRSPYQFSLKGPSGYRVGQQVAFLGYPFEHLNVTCHSGIISSFYRSGSVNVIQLDASVNSSNSGGPLFDIDTGDVIGIVTRKATGLTKAFDGLRGTINNNIAILSDNKVNMLVGGLDFVAALNASQHQMLATLNEIERQANVGIGYAFSVEHLMDDNAIYGKMNR